MIYWLEIISPAKNLKHLSNHYILKFETKYLVFTSNPVQGVKSYLISNTNIVGEPKSQYIIDKVHTVDTTTHIISATKHGAAYFYQHIEKLQPFIEKLT